MSTAKYEPGIFKTAKALDTAPMALLARVDEVIE
jgi:hypothetical protein